MCHLEKHVGGLLETKRQTIPHPTPYQYISLSIVESEALDNRRIMEDNERVLQNWKHNPPVLFYI